MEMSLASKYGGTVPRYTSYPTAPHFSSEVDSARYTEWLSTISGNDTLSLYLHIPFCREMCWYCGCFTKIVNRYEPILSYVDSLMHELDLVSSKLTEHATTKFIHWGGGSPTILTADDWLRVRDRLQTSFSIDEDAEIAVEMDPRTTTQEYVSALAACGVNRVSIGVQDFNLKVQQAINRIQPFNVTSQVVEWLRHAGINAINLDLMYGLPHQTLELIEDMTEKALSLSPSRIALFGYAHVPWMKSHQKLIDEGALPGIEDRWQQAERAAAMLQAAGYIRVGLDHFAHPDDPLASFNVGEIKRNFQGYTTDDAGVLLGFGASAIGTLNQGYVQNVASLKSYHEQIADGTLPISRGFTLSPEDKLRRMVIERLMCDLFVDIGEVCTSFGVDVSILDASIMALKPMVADGLVDLSGGTIRVTEHGRTLVRKVAAAFDTYLVNDYKKHSTVV